MPWPPAIALVHGAVSRRDFSGLTGMTSEEASYRCHRFRFAPGFLDLLRTWARARAEQARTS